MYQYDTAVTYARIKQELSQKGEEEPEHIDNVCRMLYQVELAKTFGYTSVDSMMDDLETWVERAAAVVNPLFVRQTSVSDPHAFAILCFREELFAWTHPCLQALPEQERDAAVSAWQAQYKLLCAPLTHQTEK